MVLTAVVVGLGLVFFLTKEKSPNPSGNNSTQVSDHVFGNSKSGITLVEYADFQCPFCAQRFPVVNQIRETYKDKMAFQFRSFPLPQHKNALAAHRAAEAADKQGKFWEMHDLIYENQTAWSEVTDVYPIFESFASGLELNTSKFKTDFGSAEINDIINADKKAGVDLSVDSTPTFFLNGKNIGSGPTAFQDFAKLIDDAIKAKK